MRMGLDRSPPTTGKSNICTLPSCREEITENRVYRDMKDRPYHRDCLKLAEQVESMDVVLRGTFNGA